MAAKLDGLPAGQFCRALQAAFCSSLLGRVTAKPPTVVDLVWIGELELSTGSRPGLIYRQLGDGRAFAGRDARFGAGRLHGDGRGPRVAKGRRFAARAPGAARRRSRSRDPHRLLQVVLHFTIEGDVPADLVERAIRLSREKYCSVWHSMRQDIDFRVTFDLVP